MVSFASRDLGVCTHVWGKVSLVILSRSLLLSLLRSGGGLFLLLGLLLAQLLASLQFGLGHLLAGDIVEKKVGQRGFGLLNRVGLRHDVRLYTIKGGMEKMKDEGRWKFWAGA